MQALRKRLQNFNDKEKFRRIKNLKEILTTRFLKSKVRRGE